MVASKSGGHNWYQNIVVSDYQRLRAGRGYYFEVRHAHHGGNGGTHTIKMCIRPPDGTNVTMPSFVGAANYHWEDLPYGLSLTDAYGGGNGGGLFDFTCAPGFVGDTVQRTDTNATAIAERSAGWRGSHAISPVPFQFFQTNYTPSTQEVTDAYYGTRNIVYQGATREHGVGSWGGTCTCPNGEVFIVGDRMHTGCTMLACYGGISGPVCSPSTGPGNDAVTGHRSVHCGSLGALNMTAPSPPSMPPIPPPVPTPPAATSMWSATQSSGAAALTDGATSQCTTVSGAGVFWGFRGSANGAAPDFGSDCGGLELIGTPCAPGVAPSHRYNLLLVRAGPAAYAGRHGLDQRAWSFNSYAQATETYRNLSILEKPAYPADGPGGTYHYFMYEWGRSPHLSLAAMPTLYPLIHNPAIMAAPSRPLMKMEIPEGFDAFTGTRQRKWMQASSGYFMPPITGQYMFSVYCRSDGLGDAYMTMSPSADPAGGFILAMAEHYHAQVYHPPDLNLPHTFICFSSASTCHAILSLLSASPIALCAVPLAVDHSQGGRDALLRVVAGLPA